MIRRHPILFVFLLLIIIGIVAVVIHLRQPKLTPVRVVKVEKVEILTSLVNSSGEIQAHDMVDIQTEIPGVITALPVKEGQPVKKGDVLLCIDPFQSKMAMDSQRGHYAAAQSEIRRIDTTIATAQSNLKRQGELIKNNEAALGEAQITLERDQSALKRYKALRESRAISADEYETFESKTRISAQRVEMARMTIEQAKSQLHANELAIQEQRVARESAVQNLAVMEAALKQAADQLTKTTIRSPMNGVIMRLNVDVGERAVPGIQSNPQATLMTIANLETIEAQLKVDETDITRVALGQKAKVTVDALAETPLTGKVTEIAAAPQDLSKAASNDSQQEGKDFKVVIVIDSPPKKLRLGMLCEAEITIDTRHNVLAIPIQAMTTREVPVDAKGAYLVPPKPLKPGGLNASEVASATTGKEAGKGKPKKKELNGVFVKGSDGCAHFRVVKTGLMGEMNVELLDGLKENEEIIIGPLQSLRILDEWTLVKLDATKAS